MPAREKALLVALTAAAFLVRTAGLGAESLWMDEAWTWLTVRGSLGDLFDRVIEKDVWPPLYYLLLWPWARLGESEVWLRLPGAVFGAAAVPLIYRLGGRWFGAPAGRTAALLLAFWPYAVYFSQEARGYALAWLLVLIAANLVESGGRGRAALIGAVCGLLMLTHYVGGLFVATVFVWLAWRREWKAMLPAAASAAAVFAPWAPFFLGHLARSGQVDWLPPLSAVGLVSAWGEWCTFPDPDREIRSLRVLAGTLVGLAGLGGGWACRRSPSAVPLALWFGVPLILAMLISLKQPFFYPRTVGFVVPAVLLAICGLPGAWRRWAVGLLAASMIAGLARLHSAPQKEDWRGATAFAGGRPEVPWLFAPPHLEAPLRYYRRAETLAAPRLGEFGAPEAWLFRRRGSDRIDAADFAEFRSRYAPAGEGREFNGVRVELWRRRGE